MRKWFYRVRQFWWGLTAHLTAEDWELATRTLPPAALALFRRMPTDAQHHSLNVLKTLCREGYTERGLLQAALLHDVGKAAAAESGVQLGLWLRGPLVILESFAPQRLHKLASARPKAGWRYAIYVHLMHPQIGAAWAADAGCCELTCWLIEHHQDALPTAGEPVLASTLTSNAPDAQWLVWLAALQAADSAN